MFVVALRYLVDDGPPGGVRAGYLDSCPSVREFDLPLVAGPHLDIVHVPNWTNSTYCESIMQLARIQVAGHRNAERVTVRVLARRAPA